MANTLHTSSVQPVMPSNQAGMNGTGDLLTEYADLFHGIGKLKDFQVKLHIKKDVPPVMQPHKRVPFHVRKRIETELQRLEELDIMEKVEGPTPWVSPIVPVSI